MRNRPVRFSMPGHPLWNYHRSDQALKRDSSILSDASKFIVDSFVHSLHELVTELELGPGSDRRIHAVDFGSSCFLGETDIGSFLFCPLVFMSRPVYVKRVKSISRDLTDENAIVKVLAVGKRDRRSRMESCPPSTIESWGRNN